MSQTKDQDQSMEEILQSIKRIIAEEGTPAPGGSDVLELTEMIQEEDDAAVANGAAREPETEESTVPSMSIDEIMAAPLSAGNRDPEAKEEPAEAAPPPADTPKPAPAAEAPPAAAPAPTLAPTPSQPAPTPPPAPKEAAPQPAAPAPDVRPAATALPAEEPPIVSDQAMKAAAAKLDPLKNMPETPLPPLAPSGVGFRSGTTMEDLVLEALRPMLKEWLDDNLPGIVERLVEKEVRRLSQR